MKFVLSLSLLLGELFLISSGEGVTFCVKPTESGSCLDRGCQKCETLQYYFDNVNKTINLYDNVTLVFMSGTHDVCVRYYKDYAISAEELTMIGKGQNVTVREVCNCNAGYGDCALSLVHINSSLYVESITFVNYAFIGNLKIIDANAKNVVLKGCSFHNSSIPPFKSLTADDCAFQNVNFSISHRTKCKNCIFLKCSLMTRNPTVQLDAVLLLEDCYIHLSSWYIAECSATIAGNSIISYNSDNFYVVSGSITLSGNVTFANNTNIYGGGGIHLYLSTLNITAGANVVFFNNSVLAQGGALYLSSSTINVGTGAKLTFFKNSARDVGGAIYIHPGVTKASVIDDDIDNCFIQNYDGKNNFDHYIHFADNTAMNGGDDIYGASLFACSVNSHSNSISAVASDPLRVCLCERPDKPKCNGDIPESENYNYVDLRLNVYPGESFTVPISLVGVDYGTTTGVVYTDIVASENSTYVTLDTNLENGQMIRDNKQCFSLNYSLSTNHTSGIDNNTITMYISAINFDIRQLRDSSENNNGYNIYYEVCMSEVLTFYCYGPRIAAIFINITLLPCPLGFTLNGHCDCLLHHVVFDNCVAVNETGLFSWSSNAWASIYEDGILYDTHCPFDYCNITGQLINLLNDSDTQCAFNRAGRLCGGCRENYSLAIGSSHCIQCPNNNNLALVIFFAAAGFILVFFITALNLTVSQGMVNGLIFYANIVWTYQSIFFPPHEEGYAVMAFFKAFIAWVNLDFGIETCFISGLSAFWKTWLQFIFPFYIWVIAGLIIVASRYSTRLTRLLGNRAVPVLDTLFLLSYMKLLRLVVTALEFSYLEYTDQNSTVTHSVVWSVDGNLTYFGYPHILLFLAGLATLVVLCLPYTMLLLLMQWLRRLPRCKLTNWIMRFHPIYDAYFAPLKHKHQYWFGVLLLARVILLLTFVSTFAIPQYVNLLLLLVVGAILTFYVAVIQPYKSKATLLLQSTFFINLNLLAGFIVGSLSNQPTLQTVAVGLSTGIAFILFCGTVLYTVIMSMKNKFKCPENCGRVRGDRDRQENSTDFYDNLDRHDPAVKPPANEAQPLINSIRS